MGHQAAENGAAALEGDAAEGGEERIWSHVWEARRFECRLLKDSALDVPTFADVVSATYGRFSSSFVSHSRIMFQMWIPDLSRLGTRTAFRDRRA